MYRLAYGNLTKYWTTIATLIVAIPILILAGIFISPSDIASPWALALILLPVAYNLYTDLKNYSQLASYEVTNDGITVGTQVTPWASIESYERFGPTVSQNRQDPEIKLFYASGIFIKVSGKQYLVYASASNYKQFIVRLVTEGVHLENA